MFESEDIEVEKPRRGRPPVVKKKVELKKSVWVDGEHIGNAGAVMEIDINLFNQLKKSGVINEIPE